LLIIFGFVGYGYYVNSGNNGQGEKFIGIGVLIFAFILMPLFIYHRYKDKNLSQYRMFKTQEEKDKEIE